jgi:hypothetical protein
MRKCTQQSKPIVYLKQEGAVELKMIRHGDTQYIVMKNAVLFLSQ